MRHLIVWASLAGLVGIAVLAWRRANFLPQLGHLPGDIVIDNPNVHIYVPVGSVLTICTLWAVLRWLGRQIVV